MGKPSNGMHPAEREIQEYLDGEMAPSRMAEIEMHLHDCPGCAAKWRALRAVVASIETLPGKPLQRDLTPAVLAAIRPHTRSSYRLTIWATAQAIAVGFLLVITGSQVRMSLDAIFRSLLPLTASVSNKALFTGMLAAWDEMVMILEASLVRSLSVTQMWEGVMPPLAKHGWWLALLLVFWIVGNGLLMKPMRLPRNRNR